MWWGTPGHACLGGAGRARRRDRGRRESRGSGERAGGLDADSGHGHDHELRDPLRSGGRAERHAGDHRCQPDEGPARLRRRGTANGLHRGRALGATDAHRARGAANSSSSWWHRPARVTMVPGHIASPPRSSSSSRAAIQPPPRSPCRSTRPREGSRSRRRRSPRHGHLRCHRCRHAQCRPGGRRQRTTAVGSHAAAQSGRDGRPHD